MAESAVGPEPGHDTHRGGRLRPIDGRAGGPKPTDGPAGGAPHGNGVGSHGTGNHVTGNHVTGNNGTGYSGAHSAATTGDVLDELGEIRADIAALSYALAREHERATFREELIERLHSENRQLKRSELEATLEPVRTGLYHLYDLANREADRWRMAGGPNPPEQAAGQPEPHLGQHSQPPPAVRQSPPAAGADRVADGPLFSVFSEQVSSLFSIFAEEVLDVLGRTGIEPMDVSVGEPFDAQLHRPVETASVPDARADGTVVEVLSCAFARGETVLRRADVVVGQYEAR